MKNHIHLSKLALTALACTTLAYGCNRNGDQAARDIDTNKIGYDQTVTPGAAAPAYTGSESEVVANSSTTNSTTSGTTTAPAVAPVVREKSEPVKKEIIRDSSYRQDPSVDMESMNYLDEDETYSGATSDEDDMSEMDDTTLSGTESADQNALKKDMKFSALSPFYHEPHSRSPIQVGSTSITGKDKSVAVLEGMGKFVDPAARERNLTTAMAVKPVADIDFNDYEYGNRAEFKSDMSAKLMVLDSRIDDLRAQVAVDNQQSLARLDEEHWTLENQINDVRAVDSDRWNEFRSEFRDKLATLEQDLARLSVAGR